MTDSPKYRTLDAYVAGFLALRGLKLGTEIEDNKVIFVFDLSQDLKSALDDLHTGGAMVIASKLIAEIKNAKTMIHSTRHGY